VWARLAGLIGVPESVRLREMAAGSPRSAAAVLRRAKAFRAGWYELVTADSPSGRSIAVVEREMRRAGAALQLEPGAHGAALGPPLDRLDAPVLLAAHAAWRMVDRGQVVHVGRCPGECCGWVFYDPEGRRRWCIMEICGNRDKVRRFRERRRLARVSDSA
jgi:predicted RNA-binding Zn ribbon-like protein